MNESTLFLIIGGVGLAVGLLMLPLGLNERKKKRKKFGEAAFTKGKVLGENESDQSHGFPSIPGGGAAAKITFRTQFSYTVAEKFYLGQSGTASNTQQYQPGTEIEVIFNPKDPEICDIYDASFRLMPLIPFILGGVFFLVGGFFLYAYTSMS
ncbi:DUF3592 domain-containing protein [Coraliomargarita sinensis]|nr:DUF3592 domain-containing protein [Coraliomargarita sinensis]